MSNIPVIFRFLKDLTANNNREWFNEHRGEYEIARIEFENFLSSVIARISLFDEVSVAFNPKIVPIVFTGTPVFLLIKLLIRIISEDILMRKGKNPIIVVITYIYNQKVVCWPEVVYACHPTF